MSSKFEMIDTACWADFDDADLSESATLLYLWTWSNPKCGMAGLYRVTQRAMAESRVPADQIPAALDELERRAYAYYRDGWLFVRARVKRLKGGGVTVARSIARDVQQCAVPVLRDMFLDEYLGNNAVSGADLDSELDALGVRRSEAPTRPPRGPLVGATTSAQQSEISGPHQAPSWGPRGGTSESVVPSPSTQKGEEQLQTGPIEGATRGPAGGRKRVASKAVDQDFLPNGVPEQLLDRVEPVLEILGGVHEVRGGNVPTRRGVGLALIAFPERDHVSVARDLEHWTTAGNGVAKPIKDLVRLFRTFLERSPEGSPMRAGAPGMNGAVPRLANTGDFSRFDNL